MNYVYAEILFIIRSEIITRQHCYQKILFYKFLLLLLKLISFLNDNQIIDFIFQNKIFF